MRDDGNMLLHGRKSISVTQMKYFLCFITVAATFGVYAEPTRDNLIHYLLSDRRYDHSLPPDFDTGNVTNVSVEMVITDLNYESELNMDYECTLYLHLNWTDRRLDFTENETSYESLKLGDDIVDKIWVPDLYFYHERKSELHGLFTKNQLVYIYRNGSVVYSGRFNIKSNCRMNLQNYPFDIQTCPVVIQSYAFTKDDLLLHWNGENAVKIDHATNLDYIKKSQEHTYVSPYVDPVGNFSTLVAKICFKRPTESYQVLFIAPPIILVTVSLCSFLLADNVQSRITVITGALLQLTMQWSGVYNKLPPVSVLISLDIWMLANLVYVGLVLIINALICHFKILKDDKEKKDKKEKEKEKAKTVNVSGTESTQKDVQGKDKDAVVFNFSNPAFTGPTTSSKNEKGDEGQVKLIRTVHKNEAEATTKSEILGDKDSVVGSEQRLEKGGDETTPLLRNEKETNKALKEDFLELLDGSEDITTATDWQTAEEIVKEDPRFKRARKYVDKIPQWYKEHIDEKKKKDFLSLLEEKAKTIKDWNRAEWKIDHDARYDVVGKTERKKWFEEYRKTQCFCSPSQWSSNVNFRSCAILAIAYVVFVAAFYYNWSSEIR